MLIKSYTKEAALAAQTDAQLDKRRELLEAQLADIKTEQKRRIEVENQRLIALNPFKVGDKVRTKLMGPTHFGSVIKLNPKSVTVEIFFKRPWDGMVEYIYEERIPLTRAIKIEE